MPSPREVTDLEFSIKVKHFALKFTNTLLTRLEDLKSYLLKQKYPPDLIDDSIRKIQSLNRSDLLREIEMNDKGNSLIP